MNSTFRLLDSVHQKLHHTLESVDSSVFGKRPAENEWSIGEVVHHLFLVEDRVLAELARSINITTPKVGFLKRFIPMRIVALRINKVEAPKVVRPAKTIPEREQLLRDYDTARERLKDFCKEQGAAKLRQTSVAHPVFGYINGMAAVSMVGYHEQRHLKQINEIIKKL
jgi:hypothetical protein